MPILFTSSFDPSDRFTLKWGKWSLKGHRRRRRKSPRRRWWKLLRSKRRAASEIFQPFRISQQVIIHCESIFWLTCMQLPMKLWNYKRFNSRIAYFLCRICRNKCPVRLILRNKNNFPKPIGFCVLPPLKNHPCKAHRFCVLPSLKNHCFWWALFSEWAFILANTIYLFTAVLLKIFWWMACISCSVCCRMYSKKLRQLQQTYGGVCGKGT